MTCQTPPALPLCLSLANWVAGFDAGGMTALARTRAREAIIDVIGCMLAGAAGETVHALARAQAAGSSGAARALGLPAGLPAAQAALVNGTAAHLIDFDDNFFPAITHASAVMVPALLALADERDLSLDDVLVPYVAGLEVQARLGLHANPGHYEAGWHATSTLGAIGAAAACARLLRLDAGATANALSLAASLAGGSKLQFGTAAKPLHAGFAAMHGILAAQLAAAGIDAFHGIFEGPWGFLAHHAAAGTPADADTGALAIDRFGLVAKLYPSCMSSHLGLDGILALRERHGLDAADVAGVHIEMPPFMIANLRFAAPVSGTEGKFSMNYCAAVALTHGVPRIAHFADDQVGRADLAALGRLVSMAPRRPDPTLPWGGDAAVTIRTRSGARFETIVRHPKGSIGNPLSEAEARDKFRDCCALSLPEAPARELELSLAGDWRDHPVRAVTAVFAGTRATPAV
ncbi:MmgE/PrpD family protein [Azorhizobium doebereinerae]|uniref:MmgE/PrpD family protein n=1 Tax=Azorhizobium doebereinerae TaxID=281091 RepID=UPI000416E166|nr:MmgE/PrpD family protein [Azorhizobium doebereinerae]